MKLEISIFYPVIEQYPWTSGAYMPPETAQYEDSGYSEVGVATPNGTFERLALNLAEGAPFQNLTSEAPPSYPLAMFMPALGTTRLLYSQIASTIASQGYTVVTIDSAYDVDILEYSDGSIVQFNSTIFDMTNQTTLVQTALYTAIQTRVADASFVLNSLSNTSFADSLIPNLPHSGLNTTHTAMFGHSLGGATAFSILGLDDRVLGGLNMDGALWGPGLQNGTDKPFMLMGSVNHTRENQALDPTWQQAWSLSTGWKREVTIAGTLHYDFSDVPVVLETLQISPTGQVAEDLQLGSIGGTRALEIVTTYVVAFLDYVIYGKSSALLEGTVNRYPEVLFNY